MHIQNAPNVFFRGFKNAYEKVAHRKPREESEEPPLFDSGMSTLGNWLLDLAVLALIAIVVGYLAKTAYVALFHR